MKNWYELNMWRGYLFPGCKTDSKIIKINSISFISYLFPVPLFLFILSYMDTRAIVLWSAITIPSQYSPHPTSSLLIIVGTDQFRIYIVVWEASECVENFGLYILWKRQLTTYNFMMKPFFLNVNTEYWKTSE